MTSTSPEHPPLPHPEDYLDAIVRVFRQLNRNGNIPVAINEYAERTQSQSQELAMIMGKYADLGLCLEQLDPITCVPVDMKTPSARAFSYGVVTGTMIAKNVHNGVVTVRSTFEAITPFSLSQNPGDGLDEDIVQTRHEIAGQVLERGKDGLELIGPAAERILEEIEWKIESDITKQAMFRIGCGMIALDAYAAHRSIGVAREKAIFEGMTAGIELPDTDFDE